MGALSDGWVTQAPEDDSGAGTQARYSFQHHCIARHLLASILSGRPVTIVCEWHEDFLVHDGGSWEAVSVKHREATRGPFTLASLVTDGGLTKLFRTWSQAEETARCRLMTSGALAPPARRGIDAVQLADPQQAALASQVLKDLADRLDTRSSVMRRFLGGFAIDAELPNRHLIETQQRIDLLGPAYAALDQTAEGGVSEYRALLAAIARANAEPSLLAEDHRLALATQAAEQKARIEEARVAARTVSTDDAVRCLRAAREAPYAELPPAGALHVPPPSRMTRKLKAGALSETDQRLAVRLRNHWYAAEAEQRGTPGIEREVAALEAAVQRTAGDAQRAAAENGTPYGGAMLSDMRDRLRRLQGTTSIRPSLGSPEILEGLAYELTDQCEIWWSPEGDVDLEGDDGA